MLLVLLSFLPAMILTGGYVMLVTSRFMAMHDAREADLLQDLRVGVDRSLAGAARYAETIVSETARGRGDALEEVTEFRALARAQGLVLRLRDGAGRLLPGELPAIDPLPAAVMNEIRHPAQPWLTDALAEPDGSRALAHLTTRLNETTILDIALLPERLSPMLTVGNMMAPSRTLLADAKGYVLASRDTQLIGTRLPEAFLNLVSREAEGHLDRDDLQTGESEHVGFAHLRRAPGWTVSIWEAGNVRAAIRHWPILVWVVFLALSMSVSILAVAVLAARLARPLEVLSEQAGLAAGADELPLPPAQLSSVQEFEALRVSLARAGLVLRHRTATERRALREARDGQLLLASVINASADGITVTDLADKTLLSNAAARAILESTPGPGVVARARIRRLDREVRVSGQTRSGEIETATPKDGQLVVWMVKSPWRDGAGKVSGVVTVMRDVTAERRNAARLHALQADQADAALLSGLGVMAAGLAHDLSQPLAAASNFLGAAAQLLDRAPAGDANTMQARAAVSEGVEQVMRAGEIVRSMRTFLAKGRITPAVTDVAAMLTDTCAVARADGSLGDVRLECAAVPVGLTMSVDATEMRQVLLNLIRNAAEAVRDGADGVGLIQLSAQREDDGDVLISVCDSGPGISRDVAERC